MGSYAVFLLRDLPCYVAFTVRCVWWALDYAYHDDAIRNHGFCYISHGGNWDQHEGYVPLK